MDAQVVLKLVADGLVVPIVVLGIYALIRYVPNSKKYDAYVRVLMAGLTAYLVAKVVSLFYQPSALRPFEIMGVEAGASFLPNPGFPSDHVLFTMAIVLAIWFGTGQKKIAIVALMMTILVAIGRVVALVHTPLDVVGGAVIACAGIVWYVFPRTKRYVKNHK